MSDRQIHINERIQQVLAEVLSKEAEIPSEFFVSVAKVKCAPNLRNACVYLSIFPFAKAREGLEYISKHKKFIQGLFGEKVNLKFTPILEYKLDDTEEVTDKIYHIIDSL